MRLFKKKKRCSKLNAQLQLAFKHLHWIFPDWAVKQSFTTFPYRHLSLGDDCENRRLCSSTFFCFRYYRHVCDYCSTARIMSQLFLLIGVEVVFLLLAQTTRTIANQRKLLKKINRNSWNYFLCSEKETFSLFP